MRTAHSRDVSACLQAADFAISLFKPAPPRVSSTDQGWGVPCEWAPIPANCRIGDVDEVIEPHEVGVLIEAFRDPSRRMAATSILALVERDLGLKTRCRRAAEEELSLKAASVPRRLDVSRRLGLGGSSLPPRRL